jgi:hypothetical protein
VHTNKTPLIAYPLILFTNIFVNKVNKSITIQAIPNNVVNNHIFIYIYILYFIFDLINFHLI